MSNETGKDSCVLCGTVDQPEYQHDSSDHPAWRGEEPLSYNDLLSVAVDPSQPGAYGDSPLGEQVGVHIHKGYPDIHVYIRGQGKIAEVYKDRTYFLYAGAQLASMGPAAVALAARLPGWEGK